MHQDDVLDDLLPAAPPTISIGTSSAAARRALAGKREWAHVVDVNAKMGDFHKLVPDMAHKVSFSLPTLAPA